MAIKSEGHENKSLSQNTKKYFIGHWARRENIMNATVKNEKTATAITSKKFAFTYDHVNQKIVGTDINFQKAGIPGSALEAELNARIAERPAYGFTVIPTEKKPAKQTYKGLTKELMREYIAIQEEQAAADLNARLDTMLKEKKAFPTIKSWFLDEFKDFSVSKARREIKNHKLISVKTKVRLVKAKPADKNNTNPELAVVNL